jgi:hypothetical protein
MKFRKRVKVFPGFSLNFSTSGISATVGPKGANFNFGERGAYFNAGIPGTGLYDRIRLSSGKSKPDHSYKSPVYTNNPPPAPTTQPSYSDLITGKVDEIKSADVDQMTSASMQDIKNSILEAFQLRRELPLEISLAEKQLKKSRRNLIIGRIFIFGFFLKNLKYKVEESEYYLSDLNEELNEAYVDINIGFEGTIHDSYFNLASTFKDLCTAKKKWDITASTDIDRVATRSAASHGVSRTLTELQLNDLDFIKSSCMAFHFENKNGGDLYIYPSFAIMIDDKMAFSIIDIKDLKIEGYDTRFLETDTIPVDTEIFGSTWAKVNKDGSRDKRFVGNYEIPIVKYAEIELKSASGLNECYQISKTGSTMSFASTFKNYKQLVSELLANA